MNWEKNSFLIYHKNKEWKIIRWGIDIETQINLNNKVEQALDSWKGKITVTKWKV